MTKRRLRSIRVRLLVTFHAVVAVLFLGFLALDFYRQVQGRLREKRIALEEEAKTLLPGVLHVQPEGVKALQKHIDSVCGAMRDATSPGHHIAVRIGDHVLQALAHHRASPALYHAMRTASQSPGRQAAVDREELVVGTAQHGGVTVYVSEYVTDVRRAIKKDALPRVLWLVFLGAMIAAATDMVFLRMAAHPLDRLVETVEQIRKGRLGTQTGPFDTAEFARLAEAINAMSATLAENEHQHRHAMDKARRIQEHLLPAQRNVPGITVARSYQPAAEVAGDYYDMFALADGTWLLAVADVTGHGIPAAMTAAMLKVLLLSAAEQRTDVVGLLRAVNKDFSTVALEGDFVSMILLRWHPDTSSFEYASAGHETGLLLTVNGLLHELPSTGLLLGVVEDSQWETHTFRVNPGDRLLLVTDGVTEARGTDGELFGRERLACVFAESGRASASRGVDQVNEAVALHQGGSAPADDVTIVVIEFTGGDETIADFPSPDKRPLAAIHERT